MQTRNKRFRFREEDNDKTGTLPLYKTRRINEHENDVTVDFLTERMNQVSVTDVDALLGDLDREYGIIMTRSSLLTHIKDSTLYYDKILDYLYKDYDTYYQDV